MKYHYVHRNVRKYPNFFSDFAIVTMNSLSLSAFVCTHCPSIYFSISPYIHTYIHTYIRTCVCVIPEYYTISRGIRGPCGAMDNASAYGAEDSRFESWQGRIYFLFFLSHYVQYIGRFSQASTLLKCSYSKNDMTLSENLKI